MYFLNFLQFLHESEKKHELAGVVVILDNKILLVNPKKYLGKVNKWSIPKGHIEAGTTELETALIELQEEANIDIEPFKLKNATKDKIMYIKGDIAKSLTYYVVSINKNDLDFKLYNDMILRYFLNKDEIAEAGFFNKHDANDLIEIQQKVVLKYLS